jgi:prepilin-type N-terminal cleavage/methylation domain-containing protein
VENDKSEQHKCMHIKCKGFSLIELLVVISIIGVLAAVAIPSYQKHLLATKIMSVMPAIDSLVEQSVVFSQVHGHFAWPADLGLSVYPPPNNVVDNIPAQQIIGPYYYSYYDTIGGAGWGLTMWDSSSSQALGLNPPPLGCGAFGIVSVNLDSTLLGGDPNYLGYSINLVCEFWHTSSGVISKFCFYSPGSTGDEFIPGLYNENDSNPSVIDIFIQDPEFANAYGAPIPPVTCQ